MAQVKLSKAVILSIGKLVEHYNQNIENYEYLVRMVREALSHHELSKYIHSTKFRVKDPGHLRGKLIRMAISLKESKKPFNITKNNLFDEVEDLAGVRLIHLHTRQMDQIAPIIHDLLSKQQYIITRGPVAKTWDDEYRKYFSGLSMKIEQTDSMYTSVHYIVKTNLTSSEKCEIQVRTLMEEVWGEVSHTIDYPKPTTSKACKEQIKVLARVASSCTRLVDSIFVSHEEYLKITNPKKKTTKKKG